jgi:hypothetical protein
MKELIEHLAREAGATGGEHKIMDRASLFAFAALIAEECARVADEMYDPNSHDGQADPEAVARAIRAKFKP